MKKTLSLILALAMIASIVTVPSFAAEEEATVDVEYIDKDDFEFTDTTVLDNGMGNILRANPVVNLGSANVNWTVNPGNTIRSSNNYKTSTGKIILSLESTSAATIRYTLYNSSDTVIAQQTVLMSTSKIAVITFTGLITSSEYYVKAENVSGMPATMTGTISAS